MMENENINRERTLIETLIKDSSDKSSISEGNFTLGELHADRAALFLGMVKLLHKIYTLKEKENFLWHCLSKKSGYCYLGVIIEDTTETSLGGLFPENLLEVFIKMGSIEIESPKKLRSIYETLEVFNY
jgi:hypothetical protein